MCLPRILSDHAFAPIATQHVVDHLRLRDVAIIVGVERIPELAPVWIVHLELSLDVGIAIRCLAYLGGTALG